MGEITEKKCKGKNGCGNTLPLEDFTPLKGGKCGRTTNCKKCRAVREKRYLKENPEVKAKVRALDKAWHAANPNYIGLAERVGYETGYVVYMIENYDSEGNDYIGQTKNPYNRMRSHKCGSKRDGTPSKLNTDCYKILAYCKTRQEALEIEASYHDRGYHGRGCVDYFRRNKFNKYE